MSSEFPFLRAPPFSSSDFLPDVIGLAQRSSLPSLGRTRLCSQLLSAVLGTDTGLARFKFHGVLDSQLLHCRNYGDYGWMDGRMDGWMDGSSGRTRSGSGSVGSKAPQNSATQMSRSASSSSSSGHLQLAHIDGSNGSCKFLLIPVVSP